MAGLENAKKCFFIAKYSTLETCKRFLRYSIVNIFLIYINYFLYVHNM